MNAQAAYFAALDQLAYWSNLEINCNECLKKFAQDQTPEGQHWFNQFVQEQARIRREHDKAKAKAYALSPQAA